MHLVVLQSYYTRYIVLQLTTEAQSAHYMGDVRQLEEIVCRLRARLSQQVREEVDRQRPPAV